MAGSEKTDLLPSWNDSAVKQSILAFVRRVTTEGGPDFVPAPERTTHAGMTTEEFERTVKDWLATRLGDFMRGFGKIFDLFAHHQKCRAPCNRTINRIGGTLDLLDVSIFFSFFPVNGVLFKNQTVQPEKSGNK